LPNSRSGILIFVLARKKELDMSDTSVKTSSVSFGFKKKVESKADDKRAFNEHQEVFDEKELVSETDHKFFNEKKKEKEIVIPLIKKNRWLKPPDLDNEDNGEHSTKVGEAVDKPPTSTETVDKSNLSLDEAAALAVIEDSKRFLNEATEETNRTEFDNLSVPLLLKNKPPDGFEDDDKLDVSLRPNQASEADYEQIPIQAFGMAMLRGMGWSEKEGIGKTFKKTHKNG